MSRGLGRVQRDALAVIRAHPGIRTMDVTRALFERECCRLLPYGRECPHGGRGWVEIPNGDILSGEPIVRSVTDAEMATVRRAVRGLWARGLVEIRERGHGARTWQELTAR